MTDEATLEARFTRYVAEDAERWTAVHARINACTAAIGILAGIVAKDAPELRKFIAVLRHTKELTAHPAALHELETLERMVADLLKPREA